MRRRRFLTGFAALAAACTPLPQRARTRSSGTAKRRIALTIDDPNTEPSPLYNWRERNAHLLEQLAQRRVQAMLFVCGKRVDSPEGAALLDAFGSAGHRLGNHSYSHLNYNAPDVTAHDFTADIERCQAICANYPAYRSLFRFPYLKEGDTVDKRDALRAYLSARGYGIGHVTVDTSDWAYDLRLKARLAEEPSRDLQPFRVAYLNHVLDRVRYYDALATQIMHRTVAHTLLMHHNLLNACFVGPLIDALREAGYDLVPPEEAFADAVFTRRPSTIPAGESLIWSLAHENPELRRGLRYPAEDEEYETAALERL